MFKSLSINKNIQTITTTIEEEIDKEEDTTIIIKIQDLIKTKDNMIRNNIISQETTIIKLKNMLRKNTMKKKQTKKKK